MSKIERFEDLVIWQEARVICKTVHQHFGNLKDYGFKDQIDRASVSIMNNIAEGFERETNAEFIRFLYYSKGSAGEVRNMAYLANDFNYLINSKKEQLIKDLLALSKGIASLIRYLKKNKSK